MTLRLPPVRRPVPLRLRLHTQTADAFSQHFPGFRLHLFASGTASLAAALIDAKSRRTAAKPEAIIPAYACPDLVAACVCAGVRPRLVDVQPDAWGYRWDDLQAAITDSTVALIAVNLLGTGDQSAELSALARECGTALIQDSAQYLPDAAKVHWPADYVVLSFGRGKPLNLMQGGALLARPERSAAVAAIGAPATGLNLARYQVLSSRMAALGFNALTHPRIYGIAATLPGLGVGQTRYSTMAQCATLPASFGAKVAAAFRAYASQENYRVGIWKASLAGWTAAGVSELRCAGARAVDDEQRLRLPLLAASKDMRDAILATLNHAGLGASAMYERSLDRIAGIPAQVIEQGPFPGARSMAERLFTLPTHSLVDATAVAKADALIVTASGNR